MNESQAKQKISALAMSFPSLRRADGVNPWDADRLDEWGAGPRSHGERCAARFVLAVWSGGLIEECPWKSGPFDMVDAVKTWDESHHRAFVSWVRDPWWP